MRSKEEGVVSDSTRAAGSKSGGAPSPDTIFSSTTLAFTAPSRAKPNASLGVKLTAMLGLSLMYLL